MPDHLAELQRQRALVKEHLDWLDRQIATVSVATLSGQAKPPSVPAQTAEPRSEDADVLIKRHGTTPETVHAHVRRGCFLYFFGALAGLGITVALLYLALSRR